MKRPVNVKKALVVSLTNLGDVVLTTPVLMKLSKTFPEAMIDIMTSSFGKEVFAGHPAVGKVFVKERARTFKERLKAVAAIRKEKYDLVVDLKRSLLPYFCGAPYHNRLAMKPPRGHKVLQHLSALKALVDDPFGDIFFYLPDIQSGQAFGSAHSDGSRDEVAIAINPGSKSQMKTLPARQSAELIDLIGADMGCRIFLTGDEKDIALAERISELARFRFENLVGKTTLRELCSLYREMDLVVTCDSAPLHIASAAGTRTVAVFGPTNEELYGPFSPGSRVVSPDVPCRPCERARCERGVWVSCCDDIRAGELFKAVKAALKGGILLPGEK